jgi:hypothetical protein
MSEKYLIEEKGEKREVTAEEFNKIQSNPQKHLKEVQSDKGETTYKVQEQLLG